MDPEKNPHLVILLEVERIPIKARCSRCKDVIFTSGDDIGTAEEQHRKLESLFRDHFRKVHIQKNARGHAGNAS
jgi:hypothetical protein